MSKGFHEKMLAYAMSIGMQGLGYLEVQEDMSFKGPIDKFIPDDLKKTLIELADLKQMIQYFLLLIMRREQQNLQDKLELN